MMNSTWKAGVAAGCIALLGAALAGAQDWPQWRGPNRDGKAAGFTAPKDWPKELTKKWSIPVGDGVATPALVGDKLYVFSRQSGNEIIRCLDTGNGKEIWHDKYESGEAPRMAAQFSGPRSSPAVADGKVVTLGVKGIVSCYDAASGKKLWRKTDSAEYRPMFDTASSPLIVDGKAVVQLGGERSGVVIAYDLASGEQKWKWAEDSTTYSSPAVMTMGDAKVIVVQTNANVAGLDPADGKLLWQTPFPGLGRMSYHAATPVVDGQTVIFSDNRTSAVKVEKQGDKVGAKEMWNARSTTNTRRAQMTPNIRKRGQSVGTGVQLSSFGR